MRTSNTKLPFKFQKNSKMAKSDSKGKLIEVGKYILGKKSLCALCLIIISNSSGESCE